MLEGCVRVFCKFFMPMLCHEKVAFLLLPKEHGIRSDLNELNYWIFQVILYDQEFLYGLGYAIGAPSKLLVTLYHLLKVQ